MKDVEDNNVYSTLDNHKSDEFVLKQSSAVLIVNKNVALGSVAQEIVSIPAALVQMKQQNRHEIYSLQARGKICGAAIEAIMKQQPELRDKIMARLESTYQHILVRETTTLHLTRKLSEGSYEPTRITMAALGENRQERVHEKVESGEACRIRRQPLSGMIKITSLSQSLR